MPAENAKTAKNRHVGLNFLDKITLDKAKEEINQKINDFKFETNEERKLILNIWGVTVFYF